MANPLNMTDPQWARMQKALNITTPAEAREWVMGQLKAAVLRYETGQLSSQAETAKRAELEAEGW